MTNQETLTKAIQKAIDGGFNPIGLMRPGVAQVAEALAPRGWGEYEVYIGEDADRPFYICTHSALIFNHAFAKALWGERAFEPYGRDSALFHGGVVRAGGGPDEEYYEYPVWMWHLQQMVIADDPIKYLGENI